jgi:hypothetical protein
LTVSVFIKMTQASPEANTDTKTHPVPKTKDRSSIMDAVNALAALGDDESESSSRTSPVASNSEKKGDSTTKADSKTGSKEANTEADVKRFLPEHKKPDAARTFPEKVGNRLVYSPVAGMALAFVWSE